MTFFSQKLVFFALFLVGKYAKCAPMGDLVTNLPNVNFMPNFRSFSGFLQTNSTRVLHYWFVESQNDPSTDPVILWLSGGPGCSSIDGMLDELGPFYVKEFGDVVYEDLFAWNKLGSVLFLESPAGVGFSYATDGNVTTNDDQTARDNHFALIEFFTHKFPEYGNNELYITGESYAGIYLPTLGVRLVDDIDRFPNFKGMAIGNPVLNYPMSVNTLIPFLYDHSLVSERVWRRMTNLCCNGNAMNCDYFNYLVNATLGDCHQMVIDVMEIPSHHLDPYNLYYSCYLPSDVQDRRSFYYRSFLRQLGLEENFNLRVSGSGSFDLPECSHYNDSTVWMNRMDTRQALHIPSSMPAWASCSFEVYMHYHTQYLDVSEQVRHILNEGVRVLIYNGDVDTVVNAVGSRKFVDSLGRRTLDPFDSPWYYRFGIPSIAGFQERYEGIDFVTVRGSGHFVPRTKPREALQMMYNFIHNTRNYSLPSGLNVAPNPTTDFCNAKVLDERLFEGPVRASELCGGGNACMNTPDGARCNCSTAAPATDRFCHGAGGSIPPDQVLMRKCALYSTPLVVAHHIPVGCPHDYTCLPFQRRCMEVSHPCDFPIGFCMPWGRVK